MTLPALRRIWSGRPRLLLVLVGLAAAVLLAKMGTLVADAGPAPARELAAVAPAAGGDAAEPPPAAEGDAPPAGDAEEAAVDEGGLQANSGEGVAAAGDGAPTAPDEGEAAGGQAASEDAPAIGMPRDPSLFTDAEIAVLQQLAKRRAALDEREKNILLREGLLKAAEQRVTEKIAELKKLREIVAALIAKHEAAETGKIDALVKIYEKMKPKDAARIFDELDMPVLLSVVQGMKEAKVAPILAEMDAKKAREVTAELAARRDDLPQLTSESGS